MKQELVIFFTALMYYTRIPCSRWVVYQERYLQQATRYLPVVGWIAGLCAGLVFLAGTYLFGTALGIICSITASVLLTGALHEDGFADLCDGFGGGVINIILATLKGISISPSLILKFTSAVLL